MIFMDPLAAPPVVEKLFETPAPAPPIQSNSPKRLGLFIVDPEHRDAAGIFLFSELSQQISKASEADSDHQA